MLDGEEIGIHFQGCCCQVRVSLFYEKRQPTNNCYSFSPSDRKESAESIPYGQTSPEGPEKKVKTEVTKTAEAARTLETKTDATAATAEAVQHSELGASLSCTSTTSTTTPQPPPQSLSPVPPTTSPSPYSTPYGPNGGPSAYENISPTKGHLNLSQYSPEVRAASFTQLFHTTSAALAGTNITDVGEVDVNDLYVIALSTESDEVVVWSIYEGRPVRRLTGVPRPRHLHMLSGGMRAVVLCNRELMLLDLDGAALLTKLKGVMNQKMPFYGLHSEKYVVALSRNRMYVNMINLDTGVSAATLPSVDFNLPFHPRT